MSRASGCLTGTARGLAVLLSILLAAALPVSLAAHNFGRVVFSPERMAGLIVARLAENRELRRQLVGQLFSRSGSREGEGFDLAQATRNLSAAELDAIAEALFPPGWLADQVSSVLDQLYAWPYSEELGLQLTLDFRLVSAWLGSGGAHDLIETLVDSWPTCSVEQVERMVAEAAATGGVGVRYCEPPEPYRSVLVDGAAAALTAQANAIPPLVRVSPDAPSPADADQIMATKEQIRLMRVVLTYGWILPLSLLGLIMALAVRSYPDLSLWWGVPLLIGGLLGFGLLVFGGAAASQAIVRLAQSQPSELGARLISGLGDGLVFEVRRRLLGQLLLVTAAALGLLVSGAVLRHRRKGTDLGSVPPSAVGS